MTSSSLFPSHHHPSLVPSLLLPRPPPGTTTSLESKHHTSSASMPLSAPGDSERSTSPVCSCYAPLKLQNIKSSEGRESRSANGQAAPAEPNLPPPSPPPPPPPLPPPLKSNLKKPNIAGEQLQVMVRDGKRKVSWPDSYGRDLAHVQVFHSSVLEEGEFAATGKSCICTIQ